MYTNFYYIINSVLYCILSVFCLLNDQKVNKPKIFWKVRHLKQKWVNNKHYNLLTRFLKKLFEPIAQPLITLHFVALSFFAHFFYFFYFLSIHHCIVWVQNLCELSFELFSIFWWNEIWKLRKCWIFYYKTPSH